jgi:hypothetical protein
MTFILRSKYRYATPRKSSNHEIGLDNEKKCRLEY